MKEALESLEEGEVLLIYSLSRLSRNTKDLLELALVIKEEKKASIVSVNDNIDTTHGKFFFTVIAALAELESDQISDRVKAGISYKKSIGGKVGRAPYGYKYIDKNLVEDEEEHKKDERIKRDGIII